MLRSSLHHSPSLVSSTPKLLSQRRFFSPSPFSSTGSLKLSIDCPSILLSTIPPTFRIRRNCIVKELERERRGDPEDVKSVDRFENQTIWQQMKDIVVFTGPAAGLWLCGPLMSLIDTAVIGQSSSVELAALGPGTVLCDYICYVFMFLSVATSNLVATALARQDKEGVQHQISILLFVGLACGIFMLVCTSFFGHLALTGFTRSKNVEIVNAANTYVQIRGLAWPALLVGWVAQSASLGMKDSWGPLKALAAATVINLAGDVILCIVLGYGIAGAAWATMASQLFAAYMMLEALNKKQYNAYAIALPTLSELITVMSLAAPVFVTMMSKVAFYSTIIYFATSMGTHSVAAHQVMIQSYSMCSVWGEPISQTAQSFMPELLYGGNRSLPKARMLLKSLFLIGASLGLILGLVGTSIVFYLPSIFSSDPNVVEKMHSVVVPYFLAVVVSSSIHSCEGTLLAGRDLKFLSLSMTGCFTMGALLLMFLSSKGYGLVGCWFALVGFQWARCFLALHRLLSPKGILV